MQTGPFDAEILVVEIRITARSDGLFRLALLIQDKLQVAADPAVRTYNGNHLCHGDSSFIA
jgi:hypothetical protein